VTYFGTCWISPEVNSSSNRVFDLKAFWNRGLQGISRDIYATVGLTVLAASTDDFCNLPGGRTMAKRNMIFYTYGVFFLRVV